ncbi:MAG: hypothetical protein AAGG68_28370 [Bacteroidota bacterium]
MKKLLEYKEQGKIGNIIREDLEGDLLSNPASLEEFMRGAEQNIDESGPHFDLARPDNPETKDVNEEEEANSKIRNLAKKLKENGIK